MPRVTRMTLVAVGDALSKKTDLLLKYTSDPRLGNHLQPTMFVNNIQDVVVDKKPYSIYFVDAETDDDYQSLRLAAYKKAHCFLLCYSVAHRETFENVTRKWCVEIRKSSPNSPIVLIATEIDKRDTSADFVKKEEGEVLGHIIGASGFIECSIKDFIKVDDVFIAAVRSLRCKYCNKK